MTLEPGSDFAGYRVLRRLGAGGMGQVYLVENPALGRREALKVISAGTAGTGDFQARFTREARTAAALDHPGIITVYHYGVKDGTPWFTMRYVDGTDLSGARLPIDEVLTVVAEVADALDYAHARGIVHRDIKPANIMVTRDGGGALTSVTVLDFGIARPVSADALTGTGAFIGTLTYSAPEVIEGHPASAASDEYSLACTAYQLLTGTPPFLGDNPVAVIRAHADRPAPPISSRNPALAILDPVFARALAKNPAERYRSCGAFANALGEAATRGPDRPRGRTVPVAPIPTEHATPTHRSATASPYAGPPGPPQPYPATVVPQPPRGPVALQSQPAPGGRSHVGLIIGVAAAVVLLVVIAVVVVLALRPSGDTPDSSATNGAATTVPTANIPVTTTPAGQDDSPRSAERSEPDEVSLDVAHAQQVLRAALNPDTPVSQIPGLVDLSHESDPDGAARSVHASAALFASAGYTPDKFTADAIETLTGATRATVTFTIDGPHASTQTDVDFVKASGAWKVTYESLQGLAGMGSPAP